MSFLIATAYAEGGAAAATPSIGDFLPLIILFVVFYFLLIRPQTKRVKEHKSLVDNLAKGDEIATNGGLIGRIVDLGDNFIEIELAENTVVKIQRQSINAIMPKGTMDTL